MRTPSGATLLAILIVPLGIAPLWASFGPARVAEFTPWLLVGGPPWHLVWSLTARGVELEGVLLLVVGIAWLLPDT